MSNILHSDIQSFLLQLALLLFIAKTLGRLFTRWGQPSVLGEILAGVILGPSCLAYLWPEAGAVLELSTPAQAHMVEAVSLVGVLFLLFVTGLEIDFGLIRRQYRQALGVALGGLIVPLLAGYLLGHYLPESLLSSPDKRVLTSLFLSIALAISAIPVIARVLLDLGLMRRNVAQILFASAMIDDAVGWILLSAVIGLASEGVVSFSTVGGSIVSVVGFVLFSITVGRYLVVKFFDFLFDRGGLEAAFPYVVSLIFLWSAISQSLHLEAMFGAFMLGVIFALTPKLHGDSLRFLEVITHQFLAPLFFALAGLRLDLSVMANPSLAYGGILILIVAISSKLFGVYITARLLGRVGHWPALFFGSGLNARGSMGIIIASIGLSLSILTQELYSLIVMMALVTSVLAPPLLRFTVRKIEPDAEELERLRREELEKDMFFSSVRRVLVPLRLRTGGAPSDWSINEISLINKLSENSSRDVTLLSVVGDGMESAGQQFLDSVSGSIRTQSVVRKTVTGKDAGDMIIDEANKGYDLVVLGSNKGTNTSSKTVFNPLIDWVIRMTACPVVLVQGELPKNTNLDLRVLVPTNGSLAARRAAELSFSFLSGENAKLYFLKVIEEMSEHSGDSRVKRQLVFGREVLEELENFASAHNLKAKSEIRVGPDPESVILETLVRYNIDLLVLGTRVRVGGEKLYLGPRVERILSEAPCPVIVVNF